MVDWLAGKRVRGTSSERTPLGTALGGTGVGGWVELGRTTLEGSNSTINVTSLADKRYLMFLASTSGQSGSGDHKIQLNTDTGSNYAGRRSINGTADNTYTSTNTVYVNSHVGGTVPSLGVGYFANYSTKEKLALMHFTTSATGAANVPNRTESVLKHAQTSNPISSLQYSSGATFNTGSEVVVLGWDPADTHTNNFWEELDSVELSSANSSLDSNTFTAKKYLWIQLALIPNSTDSIGLDMQINSDTGTNYPFRRSTNGGADGTFTAFNEFTPYPNSGNFPIFVNMFWINNASNEKLGIAHSISANTAGAGNAPERREDALKWVNTSNQITSLQFGTNTAGQFGAGSILKIWGAD